LPPLPGRSIDELASRLDDECDWLIANDVLPADLVTRNRQVAETVFRPWTPVFIHGDLQIAHVFVDGDEVRASSTGPRRPRATRCTTSPPSRSHTRNTSTTSSLATGPTSTST
jgi:hypothetical protein